MPKNQFDSKEQVEKRVSTGVSAQAIEQARDRSEEPFWVGQWVNAKWAIQIQSCSSVG